MPANADRVMSEYNAGRRIAAILSASFLDYHSGLGDNYPRFPDGAFSGTFRGRAGSWLVQLIGHQFPRLPENTAAMVSIARAARTSNYSGVLIVFSENIADKSGVEAFLQEELPDKFIEIVALDELETEFGFSSHQDEYPGRIITIDQSSDVYDEAIEATEAVIEKLRTSNDHGLTADVRDRLLVEVQAGRNLLEGYSVRVSALANTIVPSLRFIAENCAKVIVGELAKRALCALAKLIFG